MPLTEISPNIRRHGSDRSALKTGAKSSPKASGSLAPRGIHSMLRTTTETGDVGQFSVKPSRLPRSASRLAMARPRSGSFDSSFAGLRHPNATPHQGRARRQGPRQMRSFTHLPRPDTMRSNLTSYHRNPRSRMTGLRPYPHGLDGLDGLASPSIGSRSLYSHQSLMTLRSQRDYRGMHPNSPGGLSAQTRRLEQRAASPAFSDMPGYGPRFRPPYSRAGSVTSSPSSVYPIRRRNLGYTPDMNNSYTSFARLPSPAIPLSYAGTARSRPPSRTTTPGSFHDPLGASNVSLASSMRGLAKSPTGSTIPAYYDYSESFVEEECFFPDGDQSVTSLPFGIDHIIHELGPPPTHPRAQTPFGIRPGSTYNPVELPTSHNRSPSEATKSSGPIISPAVVPKRTSNLVPATTIAKYDVIPDGAGLAEVLEVDEPNSLSMGSENVPTRDYDLRRASVVSNASRLSSYSSTFFPNASRSSRNLTNLAARVHSPDPDQVQKLVPLGQAQHRAENQAKEISNAYSIPPRSVLQSWQLPSLNFRPFSLISSVQCPSDRPRTSAGIRARASTGEVISPTPERPMSSQSRKRFSKILDIDDDFADPDSRHVKSSFTSLNALSLKKVDEIAESSYPARFSIPPFSTVGTFAAIDRTGPEDDAALSTPIVASSQTTNPERSTVESLLDRHIEALGLMHEVSDDEDIVSAKDNGIHFPSGATDDTFKALAMNLGKKKNITRSYSLATAPLHVRSSLGSPERRRLMPRRLFASVDMSTSTMPSLQFAPQFPGLASGNTISSRPSYGWQKLASSSQLNSTPSMTVRSLYEDNGDDQDAEDIKRFKLRRRSTLPFDPTSPCRWSQSMQDLSRGSHEVRLRSRPREDFDRQSLHRRRHRIRLKMKRTSQSLASVTAKEIAERMSSMHAVPKDAQKEGFSEHKHLKVLGPAELDSKPVTLSNTDPSAQAESKCDNSASPNIPYRWSSLINVVQQPIKRSIDVVRKPSIRTMRSHPSISSLVEPINSTRFAAQSPQMVSQISVSMLAPPDLGPPLHASTFDLSIPYAPVPSTVRPTLRETQSFLSDESSGLDNKPGTSGGSETLRKKLGLHSLRNVVPASPRASVVQRALSTKQHSNSRLHVHHSCNNIAGRKKSFDEDALLDGTVGMSDFAYRKRRMVQKVKDWWMRQCVQKKLVGTLRRKKTAA